VPLLHVAVLLEEGPEPGFALGEVRTGDNARELDAVRLRDVVEYRDGRSVPQEDPLGVDGYRVAHVSVPVVGGKDEKQLMITR